MAAIGKRIGRDGKAKYRVQVRLRGFTPESATFDTRSDAKAWAAKTEADIKAGRHFGASKRHTFAELAAEYRPHAKDVDRLDFWTGVFGPERLDAVTPNRIRAEIDKLLAEDTNRIDPATKKAKKRTGATVNRYLASLSVCLAHGVKELQWIEKNPVERVKKPTESKGRVRFLSDDERVALLDACRASKNKNLYLAVVLSLTTGARQNEIMALRWPQIDVKRQIITLEKTKNGDARALPLVGEALELLEARSKAGATDDRLFPPTKRAKKAESMDLREPWEVALTKAKITDFHWHDLRHTAASAMAMAGVSLLEIAKVLGHRTMQMVARYSHLSEGHILQTGEKLAARLNLAGRKSAAA